MLGVSLVVAVIGALFCSHAVAGGSGENVLLVVNADSESSMAVANEYAALRAIPPINVLHLSDVPPKERATLEEFQEKILKPVLHTLMQRRIGDHIDLIVYSADFPTAISIGSHTKKFFEESKLAVGNQKMFKAVASINALTYFALAVAKDDVGYLTLDSNWYMRIPTRSQLDRPFVGSVQATYQQALRDAQSEKFDASIAALEKLAGDHPGQMAVHYTLARVRARAGQPEQAIEALKRAVATGWCYRSYLKKDSAFTDLLDRPAMGDLLKKIPDQPYDFVPTLGFRHRYDWGPNGSRNGTREQGRRFFLSTVLAVTRGKGLTLDEAIENLRTSAGADASRPEGVFVFTLTGNVRTTTRLPHFSKAVTALGELGYRTEIVKANLPKNLRVVGATIGTSKYAWGPTKCTIVPGAICENLTSYGGRMDGKPGGQTPLTEFLRYGAAGSSGTVVEPYAIQAKFPHPMVHVHYVRGCCLAEAFYQSVHGPFQLLIVGDALCQPWAQRAKFHGTGVTKGQKVSGKLAINLIADGVDPKIAFFEVFLNGRRVGVAVEGKSFTIDTAGISDGYHRFRFVAVEDSPIATRTVKDVGFTVDNHGRHVDLRRVGRLPKTLEGSVTVSVKSDSADAIVVYHHARAVGKIDGASGRLAIPVELLGGGPSTLMAIAKYPGGLARSRPLTIQLPIPSPAPLSASKTATP